MNRSIDLIEPVVVSFIKTSFVTYRFPGFDLNL